MAARAAKLRAEGHAVIAFGVGEPDFPTPAHVIEAAKVALDKGATRYTAVTGTPELKAAIVSATERFRGYKPEPSEIVVSCGAKHSLFNLATALMEEGDEVIIPAPNWVSYPEQARIMGAEAVIVPTREEDNFRLTPEALQKALTSKTKVVILCTPSNPTGSAYRREDLLAVAKVLEGHDCWIVVDEIYGDLVYEGFEHVSLRAIAPKLRDRIIVVDGVSKTYAMTGWRIGWTIGPKSLTPTLDMIQGQSTTNPAAVSQAAAAAALLGPRDELDKMRNIYQARRDRMVKAVRAIPGMNCRVPDGAFYVFASVHGLIGKKGPHGELKSDEDIASLFLDEAHVAAVAGTPFGAPGYLRMSYACSEAHIDQGLAAIARVVSKLGA